MGWAGEEKEAMRDAGGCLRREKMLELEVPERNRRRSCHLGHAGVEDRRRKPKGSGLRVGQLR